MVNSLLWKSLKILFKTLQKKKEKKTVNEDEWDYRSKVKSKKVTKIYGIISGHVVVYHW